MVGRNGCTHELKRQTFREKNHMNRNTVKTIASTIFALVVALGSAWQARAQAQSGALLYWGSKAPASLRFYSRGAAEPAPDLPARLAQLAPGSSAYVAMVPEQLQALHQLTGTQPPVYQLAVVGEVRHAMIVQVTRTAADPADAGSERPGEASTRLQALGH